MVDQSIVEEPLIVLALVSIRPMIVVRQIEQQHMVALLRRDVPTMSFEMRHMLEVDIVTQVVPRKHSLLVQAVFRIDVLLDCTFSQVQDYPLRCSHPDEAVPLAISKLIPRSIIILYSYLSVYVNMIMLPPFLSLCFGPHLHEPQVLTDELVIQQHLQLATHAHVHVLELQKVGLLVRLIALLARVTSLDGLVLLDASVEHPRHPLVSNGVDAVDHDGLRGHASDVTAAFEELEALLGEVVPILSYELGLVKSRCRMLWVW